MNSNTVKVLLSIVLTLVLALAITRAVEMRKSYHELMELKEDYAFITKIDFGLFNMKEWRDKALSVFSDQIEHFEISSEAYDEVDKELRKYLRSVYKTYIENGRLFDQIFKDAEKNGKINKFLLNLFKDNVGTQIQKLDIPKYIPSMAKQLGEELKKNEPRLKEVMQSELKAMLQYTDKYPQQDPRTKVYSKYKQKDFESTKLFLGEKIQLETNNRKDEIRSLYMILLGLVIGVFLLYKWIEFNLTISFLSIVSVVFLALGISMPMIDIDARMNSFVFNLFNQDLEFGEQSVFYQSKSIFQVTQTLMEGRGIDLKIVGLMVLMFSVVFPLIKLGLSAVFLYSKRLQRSAFAKGLIFHLGKWSMADVFVVALFMAYIGFYGLVEAQLGQIERNRGGFGIETVNYSSLAPGALFFATYCVLSIAVGIMINRHYANKLKVN